jgi:hypothetical protein
MFLAPVAMHIPDGFLSAIVSILLWDIHSGGGLIWRVVWDLGERQVPMMGAGGGYAGQMLNFSVVAGPPAT